MAAFTCLWISCASLILAIILTLFPVGYGNRESDALYAQKLSLSDPNNLLASWDPTHVNPCLWYHLSCNQDDQVIRVDLGRSSLSGHLVPDLGVLENLQQFNLYQNNIEGTIPAEFGDLKSIISLNLYENKISGTIPPSLGNLKSAVFIRLNNNQLTGHIPRELADISSLLVLDLSNNDLCGTIPSGLERIPTLNLQNNPRLGNPNTNCP